MIHAPIASQQEQDLKDKSTVELLRLRGALSEDEPARDDIQTELNRRKRRENLAVGLLIVALLAIMGVYTVVGLP